MLNRTLNLLPFLKLKIKFSQCYIANIVGRRVACNYRIAHANCFKGYLITFCNCSEGNQRPLLQAA
jgi:hypothetical protein